MIQSGPVAATALWCARAQMGGKRRHGRQRAKYESTQMHIQTKILIEADLPYLWTILLDVEVSSSRIPTRPSVERRESGRYHLLL